MMGLLASVVTAALSFSAAVASTICYTYIAVTAWQVLCMYILYYVIICMLLVVFQYTLVVVS